MNFFFPICSQWKAGLISKAEAKTEPFFFSKKDVKGCFAFKKRLYFHILCIQQMLVLMKNISGDLFLVI